MNSEFGIKTANLQIGVKSQNAKRIKKSIGMKKGIAKQAGDLRKFFGTSCAQPIFTRYAAVSVPVSAATMAALTCA